MRYRAAGDLTKWDYTLETDSRPVDVSLVLPHYRARNQPLNHRLGMYVGSDRAESMKVKVVSISVPKFAYGRTANIATNFVAQCRSFVPGRSAKFHLEVHSSTNADITIWLPSDFKGHIHRSWHCKKVSFSAGFTNRVMQNACMTQSRRPSIISLGDGVTYRFSDFFIMNDESFYGSAEKQPHLPHPKAQMTMPASSFINMGAADEDEVVIDTAGHVTFRMWDVHRGEPEARCRETCKRMLGLGWCAKSNPPVAIDWDFLLED